MRERDLEKQCRLHAESLGGWLIKIRTPGTRGFPDRVLLLRGFSAFVEFKHPKGTGRRTAMQNRWQDRLYSRDIPVDEISSFEQFKIFCEPRK